ncbi:hypothetical protein [uncultured Mobiluncus sp.]|uniref:hypothetical protein n=1 Tax=uncultured Mobiluncus sp. TaxID=293425 RepID=UPI00261DE084|nr:hypothetical protein [uncultured Mobiluncus sp.]
MCAVDDPGERAFPPPVVARGEFGLGELPGIEIDDGGVGVLHVVLRDFTVVWFHGFGKEVSDEVYCKQGFAFVLLQQERCGGSEHKRA